MGSKIYGLTAQFNCIGIWFMFIRASTLNGMAYSNPVLSIETHRDVMRKPDHGR
jgi:hypothetical protein